MWTVSLNRPPGSLALPLLVGFSQYLVVAGSWRAGGQWGWEIYSPGPVLDLACQTAPKGWLLPLLPSGVLVTTLFFALPALGVVPAPCCYLPWVTVVSFGISLNLDHTAEIVPLLNYSPFLLIDYAFSFQPGPSWWVLSGEWVGWLEGLCRVKSCLGDFNSHSLLSSSFSTPIRIAMKPNQEAGW